MDAETRKLAAEARDLLSKGLYGPAMDRAKEVLDESPDESTRADMHGICAIGLAGTGKNAEAVVQAEKCLAVHPDRADVLSARGWALHMTGKTTEALKDLERSSLLDPSQAETHYRLGIAFMEFDLWEEAESAFTFAMDLFDDSDRQAEACYNRAKCREGSGLFEEAMADYDMAFGLGYQQAIHDLMRLKEKYSPADSSEDYLGDDDYYDNDGDYSGNEDYEGGGIDDYEDRDDDW